MKEDNKYYTPEVSDFFVGYEYEIFEDFDHFSEKSWHKQTYGIDGADPEQMGYVSGRSLSTGMIRAAYLTKEDIMREGWVATKNVIRWDPFTLGDVELVLDDRNHNIHITIKGNPDDTLYSGECKSINEFRKIMKWLKIKNPATKS